MVDGCFASLWTPSCGLEEEEDFLLNVQPPAYSAQDSTQHSLTGNGSVCSASAAVDCWSCNVTPRSLPLLEPFRVGRGVKRLRQPCPRNRDVRALPDASKHVLNDWFASNASWPYVSSDAVEDLAARACLSEHQVRIWISNARKRKWSRKKLQTFGVVPVPPPGAKLTIRVRKFIAKQWGECLLNA